jgi:phospholipase C
MRYLLGHGEHFALFHDPEAVTGQPSFIDDAANDRLPPVVWIDPDFGISKRDVANDDHPPGDITRGQAFIRDVCNAVMSSPAWETTLLVVTYDEHGGFYDHVPPPPAPDDDENMRQYGVRVPALVVSPFVEAQSVAKTRFDHTSIIRTIFERFCADANGKIPWLGTRMASANHLGTLLTSETARPAAPVPSSDAAVPPAPALTMALDDQWRHAMPRPANVAAEPLVEDAGGPPAANDLQVGVVRAGLERQIVRTALGFDADK